MKRLATIVTGCLFAAGCGFNGVYSLPLPGAVGNGAHTYVVKVQFADVLDLVPYSAVKVNDATVGHVKAIATQGQHALVTCQLLDKVRLPANAIARVEQTSVLGEKFVEFEAPTDTSPIGRLTNGAVIPLARTDTDASVEEVLGALSMLLDGGGVAQLHTITHELSTALNGRGAVTRDLLDQLDVFAAGLDAQKAAIVRAINGLDTLSRTVRGQESSLTTALDHLPAAVGILANDRQRLTTMLTAIRHLGDVATHVVTASHADLVANLRNLQPTLKQLASVGDVIPQTLGVLLTYPTADSVEKEYFGDYGNLSLTIDLSTASLLHTFTGATLPTPKSSTGAAPPAMQWAPGKTIGSLLMGGLS